MIGGVRSGGSHVSRENENRVAVIGVAVRANKVRSRRVSTEEKKVDTFVP